MKRVFIDLYNEVRSVHFSGEAFLKEDNTKKEYTLDGQGRIEHANHRHNRGIYNGKFINNVREGYAEKKTLNDKHEVIWTYEGVY